MQDKPGATQVCNLNLCIKNRTVCDGRPDCLDDSDEEETLCRNWNCGIGGWKCKDNKCISEKLVCDEMPHCFDDSDEDPAMCASVGCPAETWKCRSYDKCIWVGQVCDGHHAFNRWDCLDGSDEDPAFCATWNCSAHEWKCSMTRDEW